MKYNNPFTFFNHIKEAATKGHLSYVYGIFGMEESDRRFILSKMLSITGIKEEVVSLRGNETGFDSALEVLNSLSLFSNKQVVIFENLEKLKKEEIEKCTGYVSNPSSSALLILSSSTVKGFADLLDKGKKEIIYLDLTAEKPWEKTQRIKAWMDLCIKERSKQFHPDAISYLLENLEHDIEVLQQMIDKIALFLPDQKTIQKKDVEKLLPEKPTPISFQIAEAIIYGKQQSTIEMPSDAGELIMLIGAFRYQLQLGQKLLSLLNRGSAMDQIIKSLPQVRSAQLEKLLQVVKRLPSHYFLDGLCVLFDMEIKIKSSYVNPEDLLKNFILRIESLKRAYV